MSYILPQVQVFQVFSQIPQNIVKNLTPFIFGEHYQLFRYSDEAERALINIGKYDGTSKESYWPNLPVGAKPDTNYAKLYFKDTWGKFAELDGAKIGERNNEIVAEDVVFKAGNGYSASLDFPRDIKIGDKVKFDVEVNNGTSITGESVITNIKPSYSVAALSSATQASTQTGTNASSGIEMSPSNGNVVITAKGNLYPDPNNPMFEGDQLTVTVTRGGPLGVATITASFGNTKTVVDAIVQGEGTAGTVYIGRGITLEFDVTGANIPVGSVFTLDLKDDLTPPEITITSDNKYKDDTIIAIDIINGSFSTTGFVVDSDNSSDFNVSAIPGQRPATSVRIDAELDTGVLAFVHYWVNGKLYSAKPNTEKTEVILEKAGIVLAINADDNAFSGIIHYNDNSVSARATLLATGDSYVINDIVLGQQYNVGRSGFTVSFTLSGGSTNTIFSGARYTAEYSASKPDKYNILVLSDNISSDVTAGVVVDLEFLSHQPIIEVNNKRVEVGSGTFNYVVDSEGIAIDSDVKVYDPSVNDYVLVDSAEAYLEYRALLTDYSDTIRAIEDISDVASALGTIDPDNPLAAGVYKAMENSGNKSVYFMAVRGTELEDWLNVLDRASLSSDVYALAPMTQDKGIIDAVIAHVNKSSTETEKRWRIVFASTKMPDNAAIYSSLNHPQGKHFAISVEADNNGDFTEVTFIDPSTMEPSSITTLVKDARSGDILRANYRVDAWGEAEFDEFVISEVISNNTLRLVSGFASAVSGIRAEVWRNYNLAETAEAYADVSSGFYSRRAYHVFPSHANSNGVTFGGQFVAAAVAGLATSVPPQQPITNIELKGFDDIPLVYQTFTRAQLNRMAEYGTLIVMQDTPGGTVYIRHQVSTKAKGNNLNETELSITKNLDSISYYFASRFAPYIGRYNITPQLIAILDNILIDGLGYLGSLTDVGLLGPQIILEETSVESLIQHPELADHVIAVVNIGMPKPFNVLQLRLVI